MIFSLYHILYFYEQYIINYNKIGKLFTFNKIKSYKEKLYIFVFRSNLVF